MTIRSATKAELKACREDPRQLDLVEFLQSLPDQALLDELERRLPLGREFEQRVTERIGIEPEIEYREVEYNDEPFDITDSELLDEVELRASRGNQFRDQLKRRLLNN